MNALSHSASRFLFEVIYGPEVRGRALSRHHLQFPDYVVSLTPPHGPRMPNGIEFAVGAGVDDEVLAGGGRLVVGETAIEPGPEWSPVPAFYAGETMPPGPAPLVRSLAGLGPGLTPSGDDVLAGYVAGLVLLHGLRKRAMRIAEEAVPRTTSLSATLLRHAAIGEVPEPVHVLFATGDVRPLLAFGHTSGQAWLRGLVSAGCVVEMDGVATRSARLAAGVR